MKFVISFIIIFTVFFINNKTDAAKCNIVNCFAEPCRVSSCPLYPYAVCQDNYCGGCIADYFVNGAKIKNCTAPPPCNGVTVNCFVSPCRVSSCPAYPYAYCVDNYCNGCKAEYYVNGNKVNCSKPCQGKIYKCLVEPCKVVKCASHPNAVCYNNYCNGCNAEFYEYGIRVNC